MDKRALGISPDARVDTSVTLGEGTVVWQFASVIRGAKVGKACSIGSCAVVDWCVLGDRCSVGHGAQIHPGIQCGDEVFIGPGAIFCNDMWPAVSKDGFDCAEFFDKPTTIVGDKASIGAGAIVLPGLTIGKGALIAAGAVCDDNVPDGYVFYRNRSIVPLPAERNRMRWPVS